VNQKQRAFLDRVKDAIERHGFNGPTVADLAGVLVVPIQAVGGIVKLGLQERELISIGAGLLYTEASLSRIEAGLRAMNLPIAVSDVRDRFASSRSVVEALLAYFDEKGITERAPGGRVFAQDPKHAIFDAREDR